MIISDLIKIGQAIAQTDLDPKEVIELITSIQEPGARNFYRHVFVVEIDSTTDNDQIHVHQYLDWTDLQTINGKEIQVPNRNKACAAPFILPSGGNPRNAQGIYSLPTYIVYEKDFFRFAQDPTAIKKFLVARLERTIQIHLTDEEITQISLGLNKRFAQCDTDSKEKILGVIMLCKVERSGGIFSYGDDLSNSIRSVTVNPSYFYPGENIVADLQKMLPLLWEAKIAEGAEKGQINEEDGGECCFCKRKTTVVSSYAKAWPWLTTTWEAPLAQSLKDKLLVEAIALCQECYQNLTLGASCFNSMTVLMPTWLTREIFSPNITQSSRDSAKRKIDRIFGGVYVLPLLDQWFTGQERSQEFIDAYLDMRGSGSAAQIHLDQIIGLEYGLPVEFSSDLFRLTIMYYSGDPGRADIHLRAIIEDLLPSVAVRLKNILDDVQAYAASIYLTLMPLAKETQVATVRRNYGSLPYLLANAYGSGYVWQALEAALHQRPLSDQQMVSATLVRINEVSRKLPDQLWQLKLEVLFYLAFRYFLHCYNREILNLKEVTELRSWQELQDHIASAPIADLTVESVEELGFACGQLVGDFSRRYWHATRRSTGSEGKDYLQSRVMTFGSSITPEIVVHKAMQKFADYGMRVGMKMGTLQDLLARTGVILTKYVELEEQVRREQDRFMLGFWSGYALSGSRKERQSEELPAS